MGCDTQRVKLSTLAAINPARKVKKGADVPFVDMAALPTHGRDIQPTNISHRAAKGAGAHFRNGDTLLARITPCLENGKTAQVRCLDDGSIAEGSTEFIVLAGNAPADNDYVYYLCRDPAFRDYAINRMEGTSGRQRVSWKAIAEYEFACPGPDARSSAAEVLSLLDDRIDLLHQTNTTLEAIAQALFKSWFVDFDPVHAKSEGRAPEAMDAATATLFPSEFEQSELGLIPKGWHAGRLGDISINPRGKAKPDEIDPNTPYFGLEHMPRKSIALGNHGSADGLGSSKFWFEESDILFGKLRPYFHKVGLAPFKGICSTDILVLRPLKSTFHALLLAHASSEAIIDYATRLSNGAKMPRSSWKDVANYPICVPPDSVAQAFNKLSKPMFERIKKNVRASSTLGELRDTLLPRLISGKLRLPEVMEVAKTAP